MEKEKARLKLEDVNKGFFDVRELLDMCIDNPELSFIKLVEKFLEVDCLVCCVGQDEIVISNATVKEIRDLSK